MTAPHVRAAKMEKEVEDGATGGYGVDADSAGG